MSEYDAGVLTADRATAEFFEQAVQAGGEAKRVCNLLTQAGLKLANEKGCTVAELGISAANLARLAQMADSGQISATAAVAIFEAMTQSDQGPEAIAAERNLIQKSDAGEIESLVDAVIAANPQAVEDWRRAARRAASRGAFCWGRSSRNPRDRPIRRSCRKSWIGKNISRSIIVERSGISVLDSRPPRRVRDFRGNDTLPYGGNQRKQAGRSSHPAC